MFSNLFSPIKINSIESKNRIVYPSLALLYSYDRKINDRHIAFYRERAKGGAGIITIGPVGVDYIGSGLMSLSLAEDESIESFQNLTNVIKAEGAIPWVQLFHAGAYAMPITIGNKTPLAPSPVYSSYSKIEPIEMNKEDITDIKKSFVDASLRAKNSGFSGIELIGSAGYLITQFLSPLTNKRTDEYGGSFENRMRFPLEVISEIKNTLGNDFPLTIRMAGNDFIPGSNSSIVTKEIAKKYEEAGIDAINVTGGWHESKVPQLSMEVPRGGFTYLARIIKESVNIPVIASNRITDPFIAEEILNDGLADLVNIGRGLIADPFFPKKAQEGRYNEIRKCIACSQGCTDQIFSGKAVFCLCNPQAGFEEERLIKITSAPKNVLVIGAGPAGLEAAVTAASVGHSVEIYEKDEAIGGQLWLAGAPPLKHEIWEIIKYYESMIQKHDITVHLQTEITKDEIIQKNPDYIISAEGASPSHLPIDCDSPDKILSAWDILKYDPPLGNNIAIIGGGSVGLETALFIAHKGTLTPEQLYFLFKYKAEDEESLRYYLFNGSKKITIFEIDSKLGKGIGKSTKWIVMDNIEKYNTKTYTEVEINKIEKNVITFTHNNTINEQKFDTIINATGAHSNRIIADSLPDFKIPFSVIGDSVRPAKISDAIHEGFLAALKIEKM